MFRLNTGFVNRQFQLLGICHGTIRGLLLIPKENRKFKKHVKEKCTRILASLATAVIKSLKASAVQELISIEHLYPSA